MHAMSSQIQTHLDQVRQSEHDLRVLNRTLAASEAKYRGIVDYAPIGIFTTQGSQVIFCNRENWILAGRDPDHTTDPEIMWEAIHPEDRDSTYQTFRDATQQGATFEKVFRFLHPNGTVRNVLSRAISISHQGASTAVYQGFNVDITALEQMRVQLNRAERLATLGQVAAGIAHEIRNPLVGIGSTTSLLLEEFSDQDNRKTDLVTILNETRRLDRIVNQIVDYARPMDLFPGRFPIHEIFEETVLLLKEPLANKEIIVDSMISKDIPPIEADRDQLKQVLLNVIHNAIEAMAHSGRLQFIVSENIRNRERGILMDIRDNGKGIEPVHLSRVFEPFFTTGKRRGTGLGLAICRKIIEAHVGEIRVESVPGSGTVVSMWLPFSQQPQLSQV